MPLSSELAHAVLDCLHDAAEDRYDGPEMRAVRPLLELQQRWSGLPSGERLVIETHFSREGQHLFVYPFAGRAVHIGLASLIAYRVAALSPATFSIAVNDYGFELLCGEAFNWDDIFKRADLFTPDNLFADVVASLNAAELAQRRFRDIARIAGLVFSGYPGQPKSARQLQASSSLFFEVFKKHDGDNLLLTQAQQEVFEQELELTRLRATLIELQGRTLAFYHTQRATPFAFPLMVERFREMLSTEKLSDRVARMVKQLEQDALVELPTKARRPSRSKGN